MAISFPDDVIQEAEEILDAIKTSLPKTVDGKEAILEMKLDNNNNWRQMEWIGFYFEHVLFNILTKMIQGTKGPRFGNTQLDYKKNFVWDFKAHGHNKASGEKNDEMILNDQEAIENCINQHRGIGFIVVYGDAIFDSTGEFKIWHDALKGGYSQYERDRIRNGRPSRTRKSAFDIDHIEAIFFPDLNELRQGVEEGWIKDFQKGYRNANGNLRRPKYKLVSSKIPGSIRPIPPININEC